MISFVKMIEMYNSKTDTLLKMNAIVVYWLICLLVLKNGTIACCLMLDPNPLPFLPFIRTRYSMKKTLKQRSLKST